MGRIKRILDVKAVNQLAYQYEGSDHSVIFRNLHGNNSAALLDQYADNLDNTGDKIANRVSVYRHSNKYGVFQIDLEAHFDGSAKDNLPEFNAWLKRELLKAALTVERTHGYRSGNPSEDGDDDDREDNPRADKMRDRCAELYPQRNHHMISRDAADASTIKWTLIGLGGGMLAGYLQGSGFWKAK